MSISVRQSVSATLAFTAVGQVLTIAFPMPTLAGSTVMLVLGDQHYPGGRVGTNVGLGIDDDGGNTYSGNGPWESSPFESPPGFPTAPFSELYVIEGCDATAGITPTNPMQTVSFHMFGFFNPVGTLPTYSVWLLEVVGSLVPVHVFTIGSFTGGKDTPSDSSFPAPIGTAITPSGPLAPVQTVGHEAFYLAAGVSLSGTISAVNAPWTLLPVLNGVGCAYYIGDTNAPVAPIFTNSTNDANGSIWVAHIGAPIAVPGTITVNKTTVPGGSPQNFTARPSWGAPLALTDGASIGSGPLTAGAYSIIEDAVPGWLPHISVSNGDPASAINVADGDSIIVSITNTATASSPPGGEHFTPKPPLIAGPVQNIPLDNSPNQVWNVTVLVNDVPVTLSIVLRYNELAEYWVATVRDINGNVLLDSLPFVTGDGISQNILGQFAYLGIGSATIFNASGQAA